MIFVENFTIDLQRTLAYDSFPQAAIPAADTDRTLETMKRISAFFAVLVLISSTLSSARAELTSRSYVQKGLVACYDGIDNAGTGVHDPTAATWADLTGNGNDGTVGKNVTWGADGWTNAADGRPVVIASGGVSDATKSRTFTVQFTCTPSRSNVRQTFWGQYSSRGFSVEHNNGSATSGLLRFYGNGSRVTDRSFADMIVQAGEWAALTLSVSPTAQVVWKNGETSSTNAAELGGYNDDCQTVIGGENYRESMAFRGIYNAFRVYDRVLTPEEIEVNAAVDKIRFRGADPDDFALGGGYSFDEDGDLCVTVAAAVAAGDGSVAIDGGATNAAVSTVVKQDAIVTLVATAADGFVFAGWEGDTDLVATDTVAGETVATIVVSAAYAASFTATFAPRRHLLDASSYVQRGLVAQYDGIENAGVGLHDANAATWADLTGNGNDGTVGSAVSWLPDGWTNAATGWPVSVGNGLSATTGSGYFTAEFACTPARTSTRECFFSQYNQDAALVDGALALEHNSGADSSGKLRYFLLRAGNVQSTDILTDLTIAADEFASVSAAVTPSNRVFRLNGTAAFTNSAAVPVVPASCPSIIGGDPYRPTFAFYGTYNAFRLYDDALTADESAVNAAVDAIRFDGADPGDFTLGGGYSFDGDGALWVTVYASSAGKNGGAAGGTVSVAGGEAGSSASATARQYATIAVSAAPAAGFVFDRWEGDTAAIAAGTVRDASVSVAAGWSVRLVAVFAEHTRGLGPRSYVKRGLVAHYDGVDNAGTGMHDPAARTWTDLTGHGNTGTLAENVTWAADGWVNAADCYPVSLSAGTISPVTASKTFTAQFAVTPSRSNKRQCFFGQYSSPGITIEHNSGGASDGRIRLYYNLGSAVSQEYADITVTAGEWASITATSEPGSQTVWKNGSQSQSMANALSGTLSAECNSTIGSDIVRPNMAFRGTYNAFRLYDRVLSDDEIKVNAAVDAVRFGGRTTAEVSPLPDGWSFDENDTLMVTISATAGKGGRLRLNGGEPVRSVSATVNQDGLDAVALTAVPTDGYAFAGWTGDTDWIEFGSAETPEIVVDSTGPATLAATFVKLFEPSTFILVR